MAVAKRIEAALRPGDTVARHRRRRVHAAARRHRRRPRRLGRRRAPAGVAVGAVRGRAPRAPRVGEHRHRARHARTARPEDVVRDADVAMYRAKAQGGARHAVFDQAMHERVMARLELETGLRRALERDELRVLYQPVIETATGQIAGFEALCRWTDRGGRAVEPREFVPIADETGLILPLGALRARGGLPPARDLARAPARQEALGLGQRLRPPARPPGLRAARDRRALRGAAGPARAAPGGRRERDDGRPGGHPARAQPALRRALRRRRGSTTSASARPRCARSTASPATP